MFSSQAAGIEVTNGGGGEIHGNEIFENRFEGICLATGVRPTVTGTFTYISKFFKILQNGNFFHLIDNRVHCNGRTLNNALRSGKCLFSISGDNSYPMHDFYRCLTCESAESDAICINCVKSCHRDHRVQFVRHDRSVYMLLRLALFDQSSGPIYEEAIFNNVFSPSLPQILL